MTPSSPALLAFLDALQRVGQEELLVPLSGYLYTCNFSTGRKHGHGRFKRMKLGLPRAAVYRRLVEILVPFLLDISISGAAGSIHIFV